MLSKVASSTIFWVFGMTRPGDWTLVSRAIGEHSLRKWICVWRDMSNKQKKNSLRIKRDFFVNTKKRKKKEKPTKVESTLNHPPLFSAPGYKKLIRKEFQNVKKNLFVRVCVCVCVVTPSHGCWLGFVRREEKNLLSSPLPHLFCL